MNIIFTYLQHMGDTIMDKALLKTRLAEAEEAYHQLAMGKRVVRFVDSNGETVEYHSGTATQLATYIAELKRQLCSGHGNQPMTAYF